MRSQTRLFDWDLFCRGLAFFDGVLDVLWIKQSLIEHYWLWAVGRRSSLTVIGSVLVWDLRDFLCDVYWRLKFDFFHCFKDLVIVDLWKLAQKLLFGIQVTLILDYEVVGHIVFLTVVNKSFEYLSTPHLLCFFFLLLSLINLFD